MNYHIKYFVSASLSDMQYIIFAWLIEEGKIYIQHVISTRATPIEVLLIYTRTKE